jgi:hypothetical protein
MPRPALCRTNIRRAGFDQMRRGRGPIPDVPLPDEADLLRIVSLDQAARLAGISRRTLMRHHRDKFIQLSPGRLGLRLGDALHIKTLHVKEGA